jgi:hypothetical protein
MVLTAAAAAAPAAPLRRSERLTRALTRSTRPQKRTMATPQKDDIQDTYEYPDTLLARSTALCQLTFSTDGLSWNMASIV